MDRRVSGSEFHYSRTRYRESSSAELRLSSLDDGRSVCGRREGVYSWGWNINLAPSVGWCVTAAEPGLPTHCGHFFRAQKMALLEKNILSWKIFLFLLMSIILTLLNNIVFICQRLDLFTVSQSMLAARFVTVVFSSTESTEIVSVGKQQL